MYSVLGHPFFDINKSYYLSKKKKKLLHFLLPDFIADMDFILYNSLVFYFVLLDFHLESIKILSMSEGEEQWCDPPAEMVPTSSMDGEELL